ncbi:helix-turn-helix domain-containing protein [Micromonospora sp. CPCC 206061]|uniref:helix-turn-helix domain-containing protein n=1 Tax=Micromonospora sp. CPCC 206061 TaxID=3122410 RepID=UPI002FF38F32
MAVTGRPRSFDDTQVIAHAKEIFWRRGYVGTSMRDLSDELGVLPSSLHAAFGGKRAIFLRPSTTTPKTHARLLRHSERKSRRCPGCASC